MSKFSLIRDWARERNIIEGATQASQAEKLFEENGELVRALIEDDIDKFVDAVGDIVVVLTILAEMKDVSIEDCISTAYEEIKDRKGKMVDGVFVKEKQ